MLKFTEQNFQAGAKNALSQYGLRPKEPTSTRVGWKEEPKPPQRLSESTKVD